MKKRIRKKRVNLTIRKYNKRFQIYAKDLFNFFVIYKKNNIDC